jgi:hypothetical protein
MTTPNVDDLAELCAAMARDEASEIMREVLMGDLTACEIVALRTILRPARERRRLALSGRRLCVRWCRDRRNVHQPPRSSSRLDT